MRPYHYVSILFVIVLLAWGIVRWLGDVSWWWAIGALVIYIHLLVFGAIRITWNFFIRSLHSNPAAGRQIALTFDDGPAAKTAAILDVLKREQVEAGFFAIGKNVVQHPELVKRWHEEGHVIGNHSYNHGFNFDWQSARVMAKELEDTNQAIKAITGRTPRLFRPPYGVTNPNLAKAVKMTGMVSVGWSVRSFDTTAKDPDQLQQRILDALRDGDIILLHDSMEITLQILTPLIQTAREKGYTFVRPDQLLGVHAYA